MGTTFCLAAVLMMGQTSSGGSLTEKTSLLSDDLRQTMTLFDISKAKVKTEAEGKTLITQFNQKLNQVAQNAVKYLVQAKTDEARIPLAMIRFEALGSCIQKDSPTEANAAEIATKYRESSALCPYIEKLVFLQYLAREKYMPFDAELKKSKNPEVVASANLAMYFAQTIEDTIDINRFKQLAEIYPNTKAGKRSARVYDFRTKMSLGAPMPDLEVELLNGYKLQVNSLKGRVVVLDFYGFWSSPSVAEMPEIKDYVAKNPTKLAWIGVNTDTYTKAYITQRLKEGQANWQNSLAGSTGGQLPMDLGVIAYPSKIIIDSFGIVKYVPSIRDWRAVLEEALGRA